MLIPMLGGKPFYVWAGMALGILLALQILSGYFVTKGKRWALKAHKTTVVLIIIIGLLHAWFTVRLWFF